MYEDCVYANGEEIRVIKRYGIMVFTSCTCRGTVGVFTFGPKMMIFFGFCDIYSDNV